MAMMISGREKAMLAITGILLLYAGIGASLKTRLADLRDLRETRDRTARELADRKNLVASVDAWRAAYETKAPLMPVFGADERVETRWVSTLTRLAEQNGVTIVKTSTGQEREAGGAYELSIDFDCDGSLEAFVPFLHGIYSEGAMLDIRKLSLRPGNGTEAGGLRAKATLCCAYMREEKQ